MKIKAYIITELFDRDGQLLWRRKRKSKSFLQAFIAILYMHMRGVSNTVNFQDTGGVNRLIGWGYTYYFSANAAAGDAGFGLVVGTGTNVVAVTDYALQTKIAHGTGSGQLSHSAVSFGAISVSDPNASFTLWRDFTNSSGGTITVNEEGIYAYGTDTGAVTRIFCIIRDKEASGVAVADGQNLRLTYTIQTST